MVLFCEDFYHLGLEQLSKQKAFLEGTLVFLSSEGENESFKFRHRGGGGLCGREGGAASTFKRKR